MNEIHLILGATNYAGGGGEGQSSGANHLGGQTSIYHLFSYYASPEVEQQNVEIVKLLFQQSMYLWLCATHTTRDSSDGPKVI